MTKSTLMSFLTGMVFFVMTWTKPWLTSHTSSPKQLETSQLVLAQAAQGVFLTHNFVMTIPACKHFPLVLMAVHRKKISLLPILL